MINTQTQIDSLIDLAVIQRTELKQLIESLPQLRDHLSSEIERNLEEIEPAIRSELEQFVAARALDTQAKTSAELSAKLDAMARNLESTTAAKYSVLMAERAENANLLAKAEARIEDAASMLSHAVKEIVTDELSRFPRAGEIDQLRKEFAEPRGLNPRGRWQVGETYNKLDLVSYNGDSYVSSTDGNSEKPSRSSEAWTLSAARGNGGGGGGVTSMTDLVPVPSNGEILIGNGSAFVNATLTAGTGISISNGPGSITINATDGNITLDDGTAAAPSLNFTNEPTTGLFRASANVMGFAVAGTSRATMTATGMTVTGTITPSGSVHAASGSVGNPSLAFNADQNTGLYNIGADNIGVAAGGAKVLDIATTGLTVTGALGATSLTAPATTNLTLTGGSTGASLVLGQGGTGGINLQPKGGGNVTVSDGGGGNWAVISTVSSSSAGSSVYSASPSGTITASNPNWYVGHRFGAQGPLSIWTYNGGAHVANYLTIAPTTGNVLIGGTTDITGSGGLKVFGTTAASSTTTGALQVAGGVGVSGAVFSGGTMNSGAGLFVQGRTVPSSGAGLETYYASNVSGLLSYDRTGSVYKGLSLDGSTQDFNISGARKLGIDASGNTTVYSTTSASSSTVGALTIGNGTAATNVAIGGGSMIAGANVQAVGNINLGPVGADFSAGRINIQAGSDTVPGLNFGGTNYGFGILEKTDGNLYFSRRSGSATNTTWLSADRGTGAATFAGAVAVAGATVSTSTGIITPAATTAISSVRLPHGTAPTSPVNGDMWTTTAGLYVRINGVTVGPLS